MLKIKGPNPRSAIYKETLQDNVLIKGSEVEFGLAGWRWKIEGGCRRLGWRGIGHGE